MKQCYVYIVGGWFSVQHLLNIHKCDGALDVVRLRNSSFSKDFVAACCVLDRVKLLEDKIKLKNSPCF